MKKDIRVLKDLKPAGPLQTQATKDGPTKMAPQERLWLLPVGVNRRDAEAVKRFLARLSAGDPPDANSLKSLLLGIAHAWEVRGA